MIIPHAFGGSGQFFSHLTLRQSFDPRSLISKNLASLKNLASRGTSTKWSSAKCSPSLPFFQCWKKKLQVLPCHDLAWSTNSIPQLCLDSVHFLMAPNPSQFSLSNLDPGLWPDPISVNFHSLAHLESAKREDNKAFCHWRRFFGMKKHLDLWSFWSRNLPPAQLIPPIFFSRSYRILWIHGLAHAFAGFIEPQHCEVWSSRIAQVCLAGRTKETIPESSDASLDGWWLQFVVFTSNIPTNHPFLFNRIL